MPWEVPDRFLRSLCDECHAKAHENRLISSFIRKTVPKLKRKNNKKKSSTAKVWIAGKGLIDKPLKRNNKK